MKITIISVGKIKDKKLQDLIDYYAKQIKTIDMIIIPDQPTIQGMEKEGELILNKVPKSSYVIGLAIEGQMVDSEGFAKRLDEITTHQNSHITFIIGGSFGLSDAVKSKADWLVSFSKMTFPHQLMKLILMEQIFRAQAILNHHPYHK